MSAKLLPEMVAARCPVARQPVVVSGVLIPEIVAARRPVTRGPVARRPVIRVRQPVARRPRPPVVRRSIAHLPAHQSDSAFVDPSLVNPSLVQKEEF